MNVKTNTLQVVHTIEQLRRLLDAMNRSSSTVGFVPTMGYLHEGHLELVKQAKMQNDLVVMSIFVNPTQFGPGEDFESYPRDLNRDSKLAEEAGVDIIFAPSVVEMYPNDGGIRILPGPQANKLCGASRPGHFDGVLQVVLKLFNIVAPDRSYFGMKDAQQLALIETFVRDFNIPTTIVRVPIVRENDGLAKSSRNVNLTSKERQEAPVIYQALQKGIDWLLESVSPEEVERRIAEFITSTSSGAIDYVQVLDYPSLGPVTEETNEMIIACAIKFSTTRLIDNIIMSTKGGYNVSNDDEQ
ncbi:pantoate--beta-alanine ligase [Sporosarcina sp. OR05]|uniref:pantoate--beta-alanine ligase n=1 Tax=Sporosarcina sp. OR05 TaxID=2969819 RepID=UPI00352BB627